MNGASKAAKEDSTRFWAHVEKNSREIASWPEWKKGELSITVPDSDVPERVRSPSEGITEPER